jgi:hypothetical protein
LSGRIGALVELAGKVGVGEGVFVFRKAEGSGCGIDLWFGEDAPGGDLEFLRGNALDIVAVEEAQRCDAGQRQGLAEVVEEVAGLGGEGREFFDEKGVLFQNFKL